MSHGRGQELIPRPHPHGRASRGEELDPKMAPRFPSAGMKKSSPSCGSCFLEFCPWSMRRFEYGSQESAEVEDGWRASHLLKEVPRGTRRLGNLSHFLH